MSATLTSDLDSEWYDNTKLALYRLCPQKYYYRIEQGLVPKGTDYALAFGIAIHKALETIYDGTYKDKTDDMYKYQKVFLDMYTSEPEKGHRTRAIGLELLTHYLVRWQNEPFEVIGIETPFVLHMSDFALVGRIDLLIKWDELVMPLDHKTTSFFGEHFELGYKLDPQPTIYMKAVDNLYRGQSVMKAVINALRVTNKITDESFVRKITTRNSREVDKCFADIRDTVGKIRQSAECNVWPRSAPQACFAYNRTCEYYALCTSHNDQHTTLRDNAYNREMWQPV